MDAKEARRKWEEWEERIRPRRDPMELVQMQIDEECRRRAEEFRKRAEEAEKARMREEELQQIKVTHGSPRPL